jgi:hypothetical protein
MAHAWEAEHLKRYLRERYAAQRRLFLRILGGRCRRCKTRKNLQIDHEDPNNKLFEMGRLWAEKRLPEALKELKKCQILCESCHRKKTALENSARMHAKYRKINGPDGFKHGTVYGFMKKRCQCAICEAAKRRWNNERNTARRKPDGYGPRTILNSAPSFNG